MQRRELDFRSADDVIAEIESLRSHGYRRMKQWNLTQICKHLTATMQGGLDGWGFRLPWIVRATYMNWEFHYALKNRRMFQGLPTLGVLKPPAAPSDGAAGDDDEVIRTCIDTCRRTSQCSGTMTDNPLFNHVSAEDWKEYMWIHAAHHLGFLIPQQTQPNIKA